MTTVAEILKFVETLAPRAMKMDWDNVGLLCGSKANPVTKVLIALDPFEDVCREAAAWGAELIVTHHPLIFQAMKSITDDTSIGRGIMLLCKSGISAINAHTNLDCAPGGVNDVLAQTLGLKDIHVIAPKGVDGNGNEWGLLRCGEVNEQSLEAFLRSVKGALGCKGLRYVDGGKPVHKVAVGGGSCAGGMLEAAIPSSPRISNTTNSGTHRIWDSISLMPGISIQKILLWLCLPRKSLPPSRK